MSTKYVGFSPQTNKLPKQDPLPLSVVQRTDDGRVKAAPATEADDALVQSQAQTSPTDDTADALMRVGAFGLGEQSLEVYDLNALTTPGTYGVNQTGSTDLPTGKSGYVIVQSYAPTRAVQIYTVYDNTQMFIRRLEDTWTPWQEVFHQENILGTVSQSGGVPTGAIIERGSNANGEYAKFADGTMICWRRVEFLNSQVAFNSLDQFTVLSTSRHATPANFSSSYDIARAVNGTLYHTGNGNGARHAADYYILEQASPIAATEFTAHGLGMIRRYSEFSGPDKVVIWLTAIGRWY